jgi:hypothetical protein
MRVVVRGAVPFTETPSGSSRNPKLAAAVVDPRLRRLDLFTVHTLAGFTLTALIPPIVRNPDPGQRSPRVFRHMLGHQLGHNLILGLDFFLQA